MIRIRYVRRIAKVSVGANKTGAPWTEDIYVSEEIERESSRADTGRYVLIQWLSKIPKSHDSID